MTKTNDDPQIEETWCAQRRSQVEAYLADQRLQHGRVGDWPAWHIAPYISIWAVESVKRLGSVGWWVICGDLPTDYMSSADAHNPRDVLRAFGERWRLLASKMKRGEVDPDTSVGSTRNTGRLAPLLEARATAFAEWAEDDSVWVE